MQHQIDITKANIRKVGSLAGMLLGAMLVGTAPLSVFAASDADSASRMMVFKRGHGVLFDGDARKQPMKAGNAPNQIADKAVLSGTMRAQDKELYDFIMKRMSEVEEGASVSFGDLVEQVQ